jgi:hypothetical protein
VAASKHKPKKKAAPRAARREKRASAKPRRASPSEEKKRKKPTAKKAPPKRKPAAASASKVKSARAAQRKKKLPKREKPPVGKTKRPGSAKRPSPSKPKKATPKKRKVPSPPKPLPKKKRKASPPPKPLPKKKRKAAHEKPERKTPARTPRSREADKSRSKKPAVSKIPLSRRRIFQAGERLIQAATKGSVSKSDMLMAEALIKDAEKQGKQEQTERAGRAKKLTEWKRKPKKRKPSAKLKACMEWTRNHDGTESGTRRWSLEEEVGTNWPDFDNWLIDWEDEWRWIDEEPIWIAVGLTVGGVKGKDRDKYERIYGRIAIISTWRKASGLGGDGVGGLPDLLVTFRESVSRNVIEKGLTIRAFNLFVHFGPTRPNGEFFN